MNKSVISLIGVVFLATPFFVLAQDQTDTDNDGLTDGQEVNIYHTDPNKADTDNDGYNDKQEIDNGWSPVRANYKMSQLDWDKDGLTDDLELKFGTDLKNTDTDGDSHSDGDEVWHGFDPLKSGKATLPEKIEVNLQRQEMYLFLNNIKIASYQISSGIAGKETPKGEFKIYNKGLKVWSKLAGLWMPFWLSFTQNGKYSFHELPIWPSGYREGADHLGKPVSHGCIRLGIGPAKKFYDWARVGTPVVIK